MALKTFNLDEKSYRKYSAHCKEHGISMSKQVDKFITQEIDKIALKTLWSSSRLDSENALSNRNSSAKKISDRKEHPMHKYC